MPKRGSEAYIWQQVKDWREMAGALAEELRKWGWGDMHYGPQPQEPEVVAVIARYDALAARHDGDGRG